MILHAILNTLAGVGMIATVILVIAGLGWLWMKIYGDVYYDFREYIYSGLWFLGLLFLTGVILFICYKLGSLL